MVTRVPRGPASLEIHIQVSVAVGRNWSGDARQTRCLIVVARDNAKGPSRIGRGDVTNESVEQTNPVVDVCREDEVRVTTVKGARSHTDNKSAAALRTTSKTTASSNRLRKSVVELGPGPGAHGMASRIRDNDNRRALSCEVTRRSLQQRR